MKDCPIYAETLDETNSARAKVQLTAAIAARELTVSKRVGELAHMCLLCRACWNACPNKVDGPEFALHLRDLAVQKWGQSLGRKAIFRGVLPRKGLVRTVGKVGRAVQRLGLDRVAFRLLPGAPDDLAEYAPRLAKAPFTAMLKLRDEARRGAAPKAARAAGPRVAYFYGCVHNLAFPETSMATIEVLEHHGCRVVVPEQNCCGVPAWANGDLRAARRMAAKNIAFFSRHQADYIITDCASCGSTLRDYGKLLDTDEARAFAAKVVDIHKFLVSQGFVTTAALSEGTTPAPPTIVTYHDPCHLSRWQGSTVEPRAVVRAVSGVTLVEMKEADRCCGGGGSFALTHRELSRQIGAKKAANIIATGAAMVATGCPSCRMQISFELKRAGHPVPVVHPIELLAQSYREAGGRASQDVGGAVAAGG